MFTSVEHLKAFAVTSSSNPSLSVKGQLIGAGVPVATSDMWTTEILCCLVLVTMIISLPLYSISSILSLHLLDYVCFPLFLRPVKVLIMLMSPGEDLLKYVLNLTYKPLGTFHDMSGAEMGAKLGKQNLRLSIFHA